MPYSSLWMSLTISLFSILGHVGGLIANQIPTHGALSEVTIEKNRAYFEGWVASRKAFPIEGFHIRFADREFTVPHALRHPTREFAFTLKLNQEEIAALEDTLIQVVPFCREEAGYPLYQLYKPKLPMPTSSEAEKIGGNYLPIALEFLGLFEGRGGLKPTDSVLDVGCGLGRMAYPLVYFLQPTARYEGFDISEEFISIATQLISSAYPNFNFKHVNIFNSVYNPKGELISSSFDFPYQDNSFEFVFLTSVFTHMLTEDVNHYLEEIKRVLKPGGTCFFTCFLLDAEARGLMEEKKSTFFFRFPYDEECSLRFKTHPEAAVAYDLEKFLAKLSKLGFETPMVYKGNWSGREKNWVSFQDIIVIKKSSEL